MNGFIYSSKVLFVVVFGRRGGWGKCTNTHTHCLDSTPQLTDRTVAVIKASSLPGNCVVPVGGSFVSALEQRTVAITFRNTAEHSILDSGAPLSPQLVDRRTVYCKRVKMIIKVPCLTFSNWHTFIWLKCFFWYMKGRLFKPLIGSKICVIIEAS